MAVEIEDEGGIVEDFAFVVGDWAAGTADEIDIVRSPAVPGAGQIGPHTQNVGTSYLVQVYRDIGGNVLAQVDVEVEINTVTGLVTLRKAPLAAAFPGRVIVEGPS